MAFARAMEVIQSVGRGTGVIEQNELYSRGQTIEINKNNYRVENIIAKGGFGTVFLATIKNKLVAIKILLSYDTAATKNIENEINLMKRLNHPNIIHFFDSSFQTKESNRNIKEYKICMEYCKFSIADILAKYRDVSVSFVTRLIYYAIQSLLFLQSFGIIHRDIKAENFLLNENAKLKLCDFGSATTKIYYMSDLSTNERLSIQENVFKFTTPITRSPEVCDVYSNWEIGLEQDVWSLGCLIYLVCAGEHPFDGSPLAIINGKYKKLPPVSENKLSVFSEIIAKCLVPNPYDRITINQLDELVTNEMKKNPTLSARTDFSDVIQIMQNTDQLAKEAELASSNKAFYNIQDKLISNFAHLKNSVVQQTNKLAGWSVESTRPTWPKSSAKCSKKANEIDSDAQCFEKKTIINDKSTTTKNSVNLFETDWPSGKDATSHKTQLFDQKSFANFDNIPSSSHFLQSPNLNSAVSDKKPSEDLLSLQSWPGAEFNQSAKTSCNNLLDFSNFSAHQSASVNNMLDSETENISQPNTIKHQSKTVPLTAASTVSKTSLDEMINSLMKISDS